MFSLEVMLIDILTLDFQVLHVMSEDNSFVRKKNYEESVVVLYSKECVIITEILAIFQENKLLYENKCMLLLGGADEKVKVHSEK